jgi:hypothetical protein
VGFVKGAGASYIGRTAAGLNVNGHLYHFSTALGLLWVVYIEYGSNSAILKSSSDNGKTWNTVATFPNCRFATIRKQHLAIVQENLIRVISVAEPGFDVIHMDCGKVSAEYWNANLDHNSPNLVGRDNVTMPPISAMDMGGFFANIQPINYVGVNFRNWYYFLDAGGEKELLRASLFGQRIHAIWGGGEGVQVDEGDVTVNPGEAYYIYSSIDPFSGINTPKLVTVEAQAHSVNRGGVMVVSHKLREKSTPVAIPLGPPHATGFEGFVSSGISGASSGIQHLPDSLISLPRGIWQRGDAVSALYYPDIRSTGTQEVNSMSSGLDNFSQRRAVLGQVNQMETIGMVDPGGLFCYSWRNTSTSFGNRKVLGVISSRIEVNRAWMPSAWNVFGMGIHADVKNGDGYGLWWIRDLNPFQARNGLNSEGTYEKSSKSNKGNPSVQLRTHDRW